MGRTGIASAAVLAMSVGACSTGGGPSHLQGEGGADAEADVEAGPPGDGGLAKSTPPDPGSLDAGQLLLTASGEHAAVSGFAFPAAMPGDPVFADGWSMTFTHFIATIDKVTLWQDPDVAAGDPSQHGPLVAELDGPWAVDLHQDAKGWPYVDGKLNGEHAIAFAVLATENLNRDTQFPDAGRLAVGFSVVVATPNALDVNLDDDGRAAYQRMIADGCVELYTGTATWNGDKGLCNGRPPPADAGADSGFSGVGTGTEAEFARIPKVVGFDLCFKPRAGGLHAGDVETSFVNCDNPDYGTPLLRGVAFPASGSVTGELTLRAGNPFRESTWEGSAARFDPFAAQLVGVATDGGLPVVHLEDTAGVDFAAFKDKAGNVLPWRTCDPAYAIPDGGIPDGGSRSGQMRFDAPGIARCKDGGPQNGRDGLCDYEDFAKYDQSTQGHWNGPAGMCLVQRAYPSPP
jgi:hypothetical protein